jgi:hypothetical protein
MTENAQILTEPPAAGTEVDTLIGSLERQRRTFAWKCGGLDAAGLRATTAASPACWRMATWDSRRGSPGQTGAPPVFGGCSST